MLYLNFRTSMQTANQLRHLGQARDQLDPYVGLPYEFTGEIKRQVLLESVHYSTRIEGNTLTKEQVRSVLAGEKIDAPKDQIQEVENYTEAIAYIQSLAVNETHPITEDTIRTIHYLITKLLSGHYAPGQYRTTQNFVVDRISSRRIFLPPAPEKVPNLVSEFITWLNTDDGLPIIYKAALAHLNLVAIHPFTDGNGRTARVLETLVMYTGGFKSQELVSLESYFGQDTQSYYQALSSALSPSYSPQRDVTVWIDYYIEAHTKQAQAALAELSQIRAELDGFEEVLIGERLNHRQIGILWNTCRRGQMTNRAYRKLTGRSNIAAWSDFRTLMEKGWLDRIGRGRSVAYIPSAKANELLESIHSQIATESASIQ